MHLGASARDFFMRWRGSGPEAGLVLPPV